MLINIKGTYLDAKPVDQPRAIGFVKLSAKYVEGRSRIDKLHQSGSLKVLFPRNQTSFLQAVAVNTAGGATWVSFHHGGGVGMGYSQHAGMVVLVDGTERAEKCIKRVLHNDPAMGVFRHNDAGYDIAKKHSKKFNLDI